MYGKKLKAVLRIEIVLRVLLGCGEKNHPALRAPLLEEEGRGLCYGICPQKTLSPPLPRGGGTVFGDGGVLPPPHFVGRGLGVGSVALLLRLLLRRFALGGAEKIGPAAPFGFVDLCNIDWQIRWFFARFTKE
jgi:hypothetical protein